MTGWESAVTEAEPPPEPPAAPKAASLRLVVGMSLLAAVFGAVSGLHVFALLCGHAQYLITTEIQQFLTEQSLLSAPAPADRVALWELLSQLPVLGGALWLRLLTMALAAGCALGTLAIINPRFWSRLRSGDIALWRVAVAAVVTAGVLYAALMPLPDAVMQTSFPYTRAALAGGLTYLLWHRRGWLHTTSQPPSLWVILGQLICGALVGLTAHAFTRHERTFADLQMVEDWLNAGYYDAGLWCQLGLYCIGLHAWGGLLAATVACFLGQPGTSLRARLRSVTPALLLLVTATGVAQIYTQRVWYDHYEFRMPLPLALGLPERWRPERRVVLLADQDNQPMPYRITLGQSWVGLPLSDEVTELVRHKLQARDGRIASAKQLWFTLHDAATWNWDAVGAMGIARRQLASPSSTPVFGACLLEALHRLPPSPAVNQAVDELLAGQAWTYPEKECRREVVSIAWRFGRLADSEPFLQETEREQYQKLLRQTPPGHGNEVTGRLLLADKPLEGVAVGLVRDEDWPVFYRDPRVPLTAWEQRLVIASATTAADGSFTFPDLFDGQYHLVVKLRPRQMRAGSGMTIRGFGGLLELAGGHGRNLGTIKLEPWTVPDAAEEVVGDGTSPGPQAL